MNYERIHDALIARASSQNRAKGGDTYYESHHIVPECMGGSDDEENRVLLTGREHFVVHRLLAKMYPDHPVAYAPWFMACTGSEKYSVTARTFESLRIAHAKRVGSPESRLKKSLATKGRKQSDEHKAARAAARKANGKPWFSAETKQKMSDAKQSSISEGTFRAPWSGKSLPRSMVQQMVETRKANGSYSRRTPKQIEAMETMLAKRLTCPHCGMCSSISAIKRYHMDNCKRRGVLLD